MTKKRKPPKKYRAVELYHRDSPFRPKVVADGKRKQNTKRKTKKDLMREDDD